MVPVAREKSFAAGSCSWENLVLGFGSPLQACREEPMTALCSVSACMGTEGAQLAIPLAISMGECAVTKIM